MKEIRILILLLCSIFKLHGQQSDNTLAQKIDSLVNKVIPANKPGGAIAVVTGEKVLYQKTFGMMSLEYQLPNSEHTLFNLASVSKHFTAYCILLLEKEGKLNLDDNIRTYIPNLPDYKEKITIRHLIHHSSGIASSDNLRLFAGLPFEAPWDAEDEMEMISRYNQLNYKPNNEGNYSNTGYFLLARIIENVSGKSFSDYISENLFQPLGMRESYIYDCPGKVFNNKSTGYKKAGDNYIRMNTDGESVYGSTNLYTSLNDITIWMQHLLNPKIGDKIFISKLFNACDTTNDGDILNYTFGLNIRKYKGLKLANHGGYAMGFRSQIMIFPENNLAIIIMCNNESIDNMHLISKTADWYLNEKLMTEKKKNTNANEIKLQDYVLKRYTGCYSMSDGKKLSFELNNDTLWVAIPNERKFAMYAENETDFFVKEFDAKCSFETGSNGKYSKITWYQHNRQPRGYRIADLDMITGDDLQKYAGDYINNPLNVTYPVIYEENRLKLKIPKTFKTYLGMNQEISLECIDKDTFFTPKLGVIEFSRDTDSNINGFRIVDFGRVKNLEFKRKSLL